MIEFQWSDNLISEFLQSMQDKQHVSTMRELKKEIESFKASKQPKPEWEVLYGINDKGYIFQWAKNHPHFMDDRVGVTGSIHSVRRLSDGEVFTVGDAVEIDGAKSMRPIYRFSLDMNTLIVHFHEYAKVSFDMINRAPQLATAVYLTPSEIEKLKTLLK